LRPDPGGLYLRVGEKTVYRGEKKEWYSVKAKKIGSAADFLTMLSKPIKSNQERSEQMAWIGSYGKSRV